MISHMKSYASVCKAEETSCVKGFEKSAAVTIRALTFQLQKLIEVFSIVQEWTYGLF